MADAFVPFTISVDSEQEQAMLLQIVDSAARHMGANGSVMIAHWMQKIGGAGMVAQAAAASVAKAAEAGAIAGAKKNGRGKH